MRRWLSLALVLAVAGASSPARAQGLLGVKGNQRVPAKVSREKLLPR